MAGGQHAVAEREREELTCSRSLLEESTRCWGWALLLMGGGGEGGWRGEGGEGGEVYRERTDSKYKYAK